MLGPDLERLRTGDPGEWDRTYHWLWPSLVAASAAKLNNRLPEQVEDVAIEALEEIIEKIHSVERVEDLKPLAIAIAHHKAVDRLRKLFAIKHGGGKTQSLDTLSQDLSETASHGLMVQLDAQELAHALQRLLKELKEQERGVLVDFHLNGMKYQEIAHKYGIAIGTVGVVLSRAMAKLRGVIAGFPNLKKELKDFLR